MTWSQKRSTWSVEWSVEEEERRKAIAESLLVSLHDAHSTFIPFNIRQTQCKHSSQNTNNFQNYVSIHFGQMNHILTSKCTYVLPEFNDYILSEITRGKWHMKQLRLCLRYNDIITFLNPYWSSNQNCENSNAKIKQCDTSMQLYSHLPSHMPVKVVKVVYASVSLFMSPLLIFV